MIGLGPNLFYGTGIPAAILILRAKGSKPLERRGRVLFINADRDYGEGRAQNHLRPQDEEKITATYRNFADVGGFARVVTLGELADNDFSCNIRRYADNAPPPEPHDVRAHLHGGVPMTEIDAAKDLLERAGLDPEDLFADRGRRLCRLALHRNVFQRARRGAPSHQPSGRSAGPCQSMAPMVGRHRRTHAPPTA